MNMPGFAAEISLYKTSGHYQTARRVINLPTQRISAIYSAAGTSGGMPLASSVLEVRTPTTGSHPQVVSVPINISGVYRDANGKCQLGTGGADDNYVRGLELLACRVKCGSALSDACAVEDGHGGCTVICNCDPLHTTCAHLGRGTPGGFGDIPITEGIGL